jgi:hypothetical protein
VRAPYTPCIREELLRPLAQLQQLTKLDFVGFRRYLTQKLITLTRKVSPTLVPQFLPVCFSIVYFFGLPGGRVLVLFASVVCQ